MHRTTTKEWSLTLVYTIFISFVIGVICWFFGTTLTAITHFRELHFRFLLPWLPVAGLLIVALFKRYGKGTEKGMNQVLAAGQGLQAEIPTRLVPFVSIGTWITHLFGGSAGREGVAVQLGATIAHRFGRRHADLLFFEHALALGMAAGFGGLFQTPLAATFFAAHLTRHQKFTWQKFLLLLLAAASSCFTSHTLGLEKFQPLFSLSSTHYSQLHFYFFVFVTGLSGGICGWLFTRALKSCKDWAATRFPHVFVRVLVLSIPLTVFLYWTYASRYSGLGTNLIQESFQSSSYWFDAPLKLGATVVTLAAGYQGGEVTPLFAMGATLGNTVAGLLAMPLALGAALGYITVFASATNAYLAAFFIAVETFPAHYAPLYFLALVGAYLVHHRYSIYALPPKRLRQFEKRSESSAQS